MASFEALQNFPVKVPQHVLSLVRRFDVKQIHGADQYPTAFTNGDHRQVSLGFGKKPPVSEIAYFSQSIIRRDLLFEKLAQVPGTFDETDLKNRRAIRCIAPAAAVCLLARIKRRRIQGRQLARTDHAADRKRQFTGAGDDRERENKPDGEKNETNQRHDRSFRQRETPDGGACQSFRGINRSPRLEGIVGQVIVRANPAFKGFVEFNRESSVARPYHRSDHTRPAVKGKYWELHTDLLPGPDRPPRLDINPAGAYIAHQIPMGSGFDGIFHTESRRPPGIPTPIVHCVHCSPMVCCNLSLIRRQRDEFAKWEYPAIRPLMAKR